MLDFGPTGVPSFGYHVPVLCSVTATSLPSRAGVASRMTPQDEPRVLGLARVP